MALRSVFSLDSEDPGTREAGVGANSSSEMVDGKVEVRLSFLELENKLVFTPTLRCFCEQNQRI